MSPYSFGVITSWFRPGFRGLSPHSFGILFHHPFLVPARIPGLVSLLFWHTVLFPYSSIILSWFRLWFRGLSPYSFGILFHHHFLVPARVPGLVSLLFWNPVPSSFPGSGYGSGACLPTFLASCSIIISWFWLGFRALSPYSSCTLFHHPFLVPASVPGLVAQTALELNGVLNSFKRQFCSTGIFGFRVFYGILILAFCSIIISSVLLFSGRVPGVVSPVFWHSVPSSFPGSG